MATSQGEGCGAMGGGSWGAGEPRPQFKLSGQEPPSQQIFLKAVWRPSVAKFSDFFFFPKEARNLDFGR